MKKKVSKKKYFHVEISISLRIDLANKIKSVIYTLKVRLSSVISLVSKGKLFKEVSMDTF